VSNRDPRELLISITVPIGELATKSLELILEILPGARRIAVLVNADSLQQTTTLDVASAARGGPDMVEMRPNCRE
jgi:hypothetical protein